jgi:hypothetical protein
VHRVTSISIHSHSVRSHIGHMNSTGHNLKTAQRASLTEMDALFASLRHRAFRGEDRVPHRWSFTHGEDRTSGNSVAPNDATQHDGGRAIERLADAGVSATGQAAHYTGANGTFETHTAGKGETSVVEGPTARAGVDAPVVSRTGRESIVRFSRQRPLIISRLLLLYIKRSL